MAREGDFVTRWHLSKEKTYKRCGFLPFERQLLTQHRMTLPSIKYMLADRRKYILEMRKYKVPADVVENEILREYHRQNWFFRNGSLNPYAMLDWYKQKANLPDTPQAKRNIRGKRQAYKQMKQNSLRRGK